MNEELLDAAEAAARLGVKKATLYAYVSRGWLSRRPGSGRTSLYAASEIDALRSARKRTGRGEVGAGLSTTLSELRDDRLFYRGVDICAEVDEGAGFERARSLLWRRAPHDTPDASVQPRPESVRAARRAAGALPAEASRIQRLMSATVAAAAMDPMRHDLRPRALIVAGENLLSAFAAALPDAPRDGPWIRRVADGLGLPRTAAAREALDAALALLADHGMASSTFSVRIAASTRASVYDATIAGLATLSGAHHGAASRRLLALFEQAHSHGVSESVAALLGRGETLPALGHPIYRGADPRVGPLLRRVYALPRARRRVETVQDTLSLLERGDDAFVNVDAALAALAFVARLPADAPAALFAIARSVGWVAHFAEEIRQPPLRFRAHGRFGGGAT